MIFHIIYSLKIIFKALQCSFVHLKNIIIDILTTLGVRTDATKGLGIYYVASATFFEPT